jgi:hypothetical protein
MYLKNKDYIQDKNMTILDSSLIAYWDMETTISS